MIAFCFYHYLRLPIFVASCGIFFILISLIIIQELPNDAPTIAKVFIFLFKEFLIFALISGIFALSIVLTMISKRNKTLLTEHTFTLSDGSFIEETAYNKTEHKWLIVQKLARTRQHIFIYISQHAAHVIPRRAFHDNIEWDSFYDFCRQQIDTSQTKP